MQQALDQGASNWRKSRYSDDKGECVEVGQFPAGDMAVRDTKADGAGPVLAFSCEAWSAFVADVKGDRYAV